MGIGSLGGDGEFHQISLKQKVEVVVVVAVAVVVVAVVVAAVVVVVVVVVVPAGWVLQAKTGTTMFHGHATLDNCPGWGPPNTNCG